MNVHKINMVTACNNNRNNAHLKHQYQSNNISFKGELGQATGAGLGMLAGVAASFFVGPLVALGITIGGLVPGAVAGDKLEDYINEKKENKNK